MMGETKKVAVVVVHGIGKQPDPQSELIDEIETQVGFERDLRKKIVKHCADTCGTDIIVEGVHWSAVLNRRQDELQDRVDIGRSPYGAVRKFLIEFAADAIAYQTSNTSWVYKGIHTIFAMTLARLRAKAGPDAPLVVIAHSLGTIVASNYIYDLQHDEPFGSNELIAPAIRHVMGDDPSPLERGQTLTALYTLGSPLALWSLLYRNIDYGEPVLIPPPNSILDPDIVPHEWVNIYDRDDVIGYPLKRLNDLYAQNVTRDVEMNIGGFLSSKTPLSHMQYWTDNDVTRLISDQIIEIWHAANDPQPA